MSLDSLIDGINEIRIQESTFEDDMTQIISTIEIDNIQLVISGKTYPIGTDSKIVSKAIEIVACTHLQSQLAEKNIRFAVNPCQNSYPDCIAYPDDKPVAIDIKTSYVKSCDKINGFTLGTYKGYFRNRDCCTNTTIPYNQFKQHYCICFIYERLPNGDGIEVKHKIFTEKWKLASKNAGSGNTTNIGSVTKMSDIINGKSVFANAQEFDQYWIAYK